MNLDKLIKRAIPGALILPTIFAIGTIIYTMMPICQAPKPAPEIKKPDARPHYELPLAYLNAIHNDYFFRGRKI